MSAYKHIALVGASGNVGQAILNALIASPANFNITLLVRAESTSTIPQSSSPAIKMVKGDFQNENFLRSSLTGQDSLVLALNSTPTNLELQNTLSTIAAAVGVKRIIPSDFGSDVTNPAIVEAVPPYQAKVDATNFIEEIASSNPGTSWTAVINGPFYDWCLERNLFGFNPKTRTAVLYDDGVGRFDTTNLPTVGQVVARILTTPDKFQNKHVYVSEFTVSQTDIFNSLLRVTGTVREDWKVEHRTSESLRTQGRGKLEQNDFTGVYDLIFAALYQPGLGSDFSATRALDNKVLGVAEGDLLEVTRNVFQRM